jgi:hypothetical protein
MFNRRLFLSLMLVAIPASADLLQVAVSGTFDQYPPVTEVSSPFTTWAITFDIDSQPTVASSDPDDDFYAPGSNLAFDLNGVAVSGVSLDGDVYFDTTTLDTGMVISVKDSDNDMVDFRTKGPLLFSGDTANPEILTGTFDPQSSFALFQLSDETQISSTADINEGPITITDLSAVPEPRANLLLGTVLAGFAFLLRRRIGLSASRKESQG